MAEKPQPAPQQPAMNPGMTPLNAWGMYPPMFGFPPVHPGPQPHPDPIPPTSMRNDMPYGMNADPISAFFRYMAQTGPFKTE